MARKLGINPKSIARAKKKGEENLEMTNINSSWTILARTTRSDSTPEHHQNLAHDFWASKGISRTAPNENDIVRKRIAPKKYISNPRQILEKTQREAYIALKEKYLQIKMDQRTL